MTRFILKRILVGLVTIWFIWSLVFVMVRLSGDPIEWMLPEGATAEAEQQLRASLGLDLPLYQQYIKNFTNIVTGDLGVSYYYKRQVSDLFAERLPYTYMIGLPS